MPHNLIGWPPRRPAVTRWPTADVQWCYFIFLVYRLLTGLSWPGPKVLLCLRLCLFLSLYQTNFHVTLRILRWIWLHAQSVLCLIQPCSVCYSNGTVCASICTGCASSVWLGAKQHVATYCTYSIMSAVGNRQHTSCNPLHNGTTQGTQTTTYSTQC